MLIWRYLQHHLNKISMTHHIDVFNGDADGICALIQLRLANPVESQLITGVKRDIALLQKLKLTRKIKSRYLISHWIAIAVIWIV